MMLAWNILQLALLMLMAAKLHGHSLCRDTTKNCDNDGTKATQAPTTPQRTSPAPTTPQATTPKPKTTAIAQTKKEPCQDPCKFGFCAAYPNATCKRSKQDRCKPEFHTHDGKEIDITCCGTDCSAKCDSNSVSPICASDGKVYLNLCLLNIAKCKSKGMLSMLYETIPHTCIRYPDENCPDPCVGAYCAKTPNSFCQAKYPNVCKKELYHMTTKLKTREEDCEDACGLAPEPSTCFADERKWYYDQKAGRCKIFSWGGCEKNDNHFDTEKECMKACQGFKGTKCSEECPDDVDEYCATNGKTFKNLCHLNVAICRSRGKLARKHAGPCE